MQKVPYYTTLAGAAAAEAIAALKAGSLEVRRLQEYFEVIITNVCSISATYPAHALLTPIGKQYICSSTINSYQINHLIYFIWRL